MFVKECVYVSFGFTHARPCDSDISDFKEHIYFHNLNYFKSREWDILC